MRALEKDCKTKSRGLEIALESGITEIAISDVTSKSGTSHIQSMKLVDLARSSLLELDTD